MPNQNIKLEIACCNYESCINAQNAGAHRIELFESLGDGGCTPSYGMIKQVMQDVNVPIYVMIRPRGGNFTYSESEIEIMKADIEMCIQLKVDGIVFGMLNSEGSVNTQQCKALLNIWQNKPATFHRAIDRARDIFISTEQIIDLGFERILTSGGARNVDEGRDAINELQSRFGQKITIMPGAGITAKNARDIVNYCNVHEIHATAKQTKVSNSSNGIFEDSYGYSDDEIIRSILAEIK